MPNPRFTYGRIGALADSHGLAKEMPSVFERALSRFNPVDQDRLTRTMHQWAINSGTGRSVVSNIQHEHYLPAARMFALLRAIMRHAIPPYDAKKITTSFAHICERHILKGPVITAPLPAVVGRATDKEKLIKALKVSYSHIFYGTRGARDFVDRIQKSTCTLTPQEADIAISRNPAFVTWSAALTDNPFDFLRTTRADEVRASLGLKSTRRGAGPYLLLFSYTRGFDNLHFPTVADAGTYEFFLSAPFGALHGWTRPWPEEELAHVKHPRGNTLLPQPRPEAVQKAAFFNRLKFPVKCLS